MPEVTSDEWENLIQEAITENSVGVKDSWQERVNEVVAMGRTEADLVTDLASSIMRNAEPSDWAGPESYRSFLRRGVYSPVQLLLYYCARQDKARVEHDYPFFFDSVGRLVSMLTQTREGDSGPETGVTVLDGCLYWQVLQAVFHLREMHEEGEHLSLELHLPLGGNFPDSEVLPVKKLAQLFGRGVGVASGKGLGQRVKTNGGVQKIYPDHLGTPSNLLYELRPAFQKIPSIALVLRRDRLVTIAKVGNPLLEFYDGGWHVADLNSGRGVLDSALDDHFKKRPEGLSEFLLRLAYHMASHWHSGILSVADIGKLQKADILEPQTDWSITATNIIKKKASVLGFPEVRITDIEESKLGRVFLTNAIQDGAVLFQPDGQFHSAGRFVIRIASESAGEDSPKDDNPPKQELKEQGTLPPRKSDAKGSGNRAARQIARFGVAIKISRDGAIRVYSNPSVPADGKSVMTPLDGLRIR